MSISDFFSASYAEARDKFRDAARAAGAALDTHHNPAAAPDGLQLTTETARLGPRQAERLLILMSGTHGVEGFCGSGLQVGLLKSGLAADHPADTAVLLIHAINPSGFAWNRRGTEGNRDPNSNFLVENLTLPDHPAAATVARVQPIRGTNCCARRFVRGTGVPRGAPRPTPFSMPMEPRMARWPCRPRSAPGSSSIQTASSMAGGDRFGRIGRCAKFLGATWSGPVMSPSSIFTAVSAPM